MDADALISGQYLLEQRADEAAIEMAYGGLVASPTETCEIAVTCLLYTSDAADE